MITLLSYIQSDPGAQDCHENFILKPQIGKKSLPKFTFTRTELQTLAYFGDNEVAEQVLEWLDMQGKDNIIIIDNYYVCVRFVYPS